MNNKKIFLLLSLFTFNVLLGQEFPMIKKAAITSEVFHQGQGLFFYKYTVLNDSSSSGDIFSFDIDVSLETEAVIDTTGLRFCNALLKNFFTKGYSFWKGKVIPIGISQIPNGWDCSINLSTLRIDFSGFPEIEARNKSDSFEINCMALPAIKKTTFSIAKDIVIDQLPSIEDTSYAMTEEQMDSILSSLDFSTFTVGPNIFPGDIECVGIVDSMISYINRSVELKWINTEQTKNKYESYLTNAKTLLQQGDFLQARSYLQNIINDVNIDSSGAITSEAYALLRYNTEYLLSKLPEPGLKVKLKNSSGTKLPGGSLQYYEGGWKNAIDNGNGTFTVDTQLKTVSLRMTYEYGTQTKSNITVTTDTVVFQTVNTLVKLQDSNGNAIDTGSVQYYAGGWRVFGNTINGVTSKELLANNYTFRVSYAFASKDKAQDLNTNTTVVFQTVNSRVELRNSNGELIDQGTVQYYSGGWREFGTTSNGIVNKELLANNYTFRMSYAFASKDKAQDLNTNTTVVFQTVNANVELRNSLSELMDQGTVQYYSGGWRNLGTTINGIASKELLANNYTFRMTYAYASKDKVQDLNTSATVVFQTVTAKVELRNSVGELIDQGTVQYYSGGWREFGATVNGAVNKELLANNYTFRMSYASANKDKAQDLNTNTTIIFQTTDTKVELRNSVGELMDQGIVQYYSGGWREFGATVNGIASKELLANNYTFRMSYAFASKDKTQDLNTNATVVFQTVNAKVELRNSIGELMDLGTVQYYSGGWRSFGTTSGGTTSKELLPNNYTFRITHEFISNDKAQNVETNNTILFSTVLSTVRVKDSQNQPVNSATASYYSGGWRTIGTTINGEATKELLPSNLTFRVNDGTTQQDKTQNLSTNNVVEFIFP